MAVRLLFTQATLCGQWKHGIYCLPKLIRMDLVAGNGQRRGCGVRPTRQLSNNRLMELSRREGGSRDGDARGRGQDRLSLWPVLRGCHDDQRGPSQFLQWRQPRSRLVVCHASRDVVVGARDAAATGARLRVSGKKKNMIC